MTSLDVFACPELSDQLTQRVASHQEKVLQSGHTQAAYLQLRDGTLKISVECFTET